MSNLISHMSPLVGNENMKSHSLNLNLKQACLYALEEKPEFYSSPRLHTALRKHVPISNSSHPMFTNSAVLFCSVAHCPAHC